MARPLQLALAMALVALTLPLLASPGCSSERGDSPGSGGMATASAGQSSDTKSPGGVKRYGYEIVHTYPHDRGAYTQGLLFHEGKLYESTGRPKESSVRRVEVETGEVERKHDLPPPLFGEGLALHKGALIQLTWKAGKAIVYDKRNFQELYRKSYKGEGWGLTAHGGWLVMSDGTDKLRFLDPKTFEEHHRLKVRRSGRPAYDLNELESIEGELWANVYQREEILRIDPETGKVTGVVELHGLQSEQGIEDPVQDVLNGIAYDAEKKRIFITGKYWPNLYEIRVVER